jgi:hypothetical protein
MRTISLENFHSELKAQGVKTHLDFAFRCPICKTIQSARDLIKAGAGEDFDRVESVLAFSCVGRWTNAGTHKKDDPPGRGCNWTLGGLFQLHELTVVGEDGKKHPRFELATPDEAQAHAAKHAEQVA